MCTHLILFSPIICHHRSSTVLGHIELPGISWIYFIDLYRKKILQNVKFIKRR